MKDLELMNRSLKLKNDSLEEQVAALKLAEDSAVESEVTHDLNLKVTNLESKLSYMEREQELLDLVVNDLYNKLVRIEPVAHAADALAEPPAHDPPFYKIDDLDSETTEYSDDEYDDDAPAFEPPPPPPSDEQSFDEPSTRFVLSDAQFIKMSTLVQKVAVHHGITITL
jgi:hypothetical protein